MDQKSDSVLQIAVDQMHEGIQIIDRDWRYLYVNEAAVRHARLPRQSLVGSKMTELFPQIRESDLWRTMKDVMDTGLPRQMENLFEYADSEKSWYELFIEPYVNGILIRSIDITSKKRLQEEMHFAQKMEAIGRLAGGLAHDFNNKLSVITVLAEMALDKSKADVEMKGWLGSILQACEQSASLTRQLLAFSRKEVLDLKVCNLNDLLNETSKGLANMLGESIHIVCQLGHNLGHVRIDPSLMDQIFLNLVINARDAMPRGGTLEVRTENADLDEDYCRHRPEIVPGSYVVLSVSDTGVGMSAAVRKRLFEPFFTTKARGKGTGLGMPMVHGIMTQFHGHLRVFSQPGAGTTIRCYLPRVDEPVDTTVVDSERRMGEGGHESILLVEDEALLRSALQTALKNAGYRTFATGDITEAKKIFAENSIDLLITDVVLGAQTGVQLSADLKLNAPSLKVLYISGYNEEMLADEGLEGDDLVLMRKPIWMPKLLDVIRRLFDGQLVRGVI